MSLQITAPRDMPATVTRTRTQSTNVGQGDAVYNKWRELYSTHPENTPSYSYTSSDEGFLSTGSVLSFSGWQFASGPAGSSMTIGDGDG